MLSLFPNGVEACVSSATDGRRMGLLQIIQDLGVPLSIRETSDSKGRGVFCNKVAFTIHTHQRCTIMPRMPRRNTGYNIGRSPCSVATFSHGSSQKRLRVMLLVLKLARLRNYGPRPTVTFI